MTAKSENAFFEAIPTAFTFLFSKIPFWQALDQIPDFFHQLNYVKHKDTRISAYAHLENQEQIYIAHGVTIEPNCLIQGPVFLGPNSLIRHGSYVRPYTIAMGNNVIGHSTEIKNSILFPHAKAPHFNYVGDSILGHNVNLGAGTILSNLRFDRKNVELKIFEQIIPTNRQKFGAIVGDHVQIGVNCVLNPGTIIGPQSLIRPATQLKGFYPPKSMI